MKNSVISKNIKEKLDFCDYIVYNAMGIWSGGLIDMDSAGDFSEKFVGSEGFARSDYIAVLAEEDGVCIIGLTRGSDTRFHHTEKLNCGEVYLAQFTEMTSAVKIRGKAKIYTCHGVIQAT